LRTELDEKNAEFQMIQQTMQALEFKIKSFENSESKFKSIIQSLEDNLRELETQKKTFEEASSKSVQDLKSQKKHLETLLSETKDQYETQIDLIKDQFSQKLQELDENLKEALEKLGQSEEALKSKSSKTQKYQAKIQELEQKITEYSEALSSKDHRIQDLQAELSDQKQQLEVLNSNLNAISVDFSRSQNQLFILTEKNDALMLTVESLNDSLTESKSELSNSSAQISDLTSKNSEFEQKIQLLSNSLKSSERSNSELMSKIDDLESSISRCLSDIRTLESEKNSLIESSKYKKSSNELENEDLDFSVDGHREMIMQFLVCKVVKYENRTWCLIYVQNQQPEYLWHEKYILQELNPSTEFPTPYEDQLESRIQDLESKLSVLNEIQGLSYPENVQSQDILTTIKSLVSHFNGRKSISKPIRVGSYEPDVSSPAISNFTGEQDLRSESEVQITAEEAGSLFQKMTTLHKENEELESNIQLLKMQLQYFKDQEHSGTFQKSSNNSVDQVRGVLMSVLENLPLQNEDIESKISVMLQILGMTKEAKEGLLVKRNAKSKPEKSGFKKLFSKKK